MKQKSNIKEEMQNLDIDPVAETILLKGEKVKPTKLSPPYKKHLHRRMEHIIIPGVHVVCVLYK